MVLTDILDEAINHSLIILEHEILKNKLSYFSDKGKDGWSPLKQSTIERKGRLVKNGEIPAENVNKFNTRYGSLRESLKVTTQVLSNEIQITVTANHPGGDEVIYDLIDRLGRDFLRFDETEKVWILKRLKELISDYIGGKFG